MFGLLALLPFELTAERFWYKLVASSATNVKLLEVNRDENLILLAKLDDPDDPNGPDGSSGLDGLDGLDGLGGLGGPNGPGGLQFGDEI